MSGEKVDRRRGPEAAARARARQAAAVAERLERLETEAAALRTTAAELAAREEAAVRAAVAARRAAEEEAARARRAADEARLLRRRAEEREAEAARAAAVPVRKDGRPDARTVQGRAVLGLPSLAELREERRAGLVRVTYRGRVMLVDAEEAALLRERQEEEARGDFTVNDLPPAPSKPVGPGRPRGELWTLDADGGWRLTEAGQRAAVAAARRLRGEAAADVEEAAGGIGWGGVAIGQAHPEPALDAVALAWGALSLLGALEARLDGEADEDTGEIPTIEAVGFPVVNADGEYLAVWCPVEEDDTGTPTATPGVVLVNFLNNSVHKYLSGAAWIETVLSDLRVSVSGQGGAPSAIGDAKSGYSDKRGLPVELDLSMPAPLEGVDLSALRKALANVGQR